MTTPAPAMSTTMRGVMTVSSVAPAPASASASASTTAATTTTVSVSSGNRSRGHECHPRQHWNHSSRLADSCAHGNRGRKAHCRVHLSATVLLDTPIQDNQSVRNLLCSLSPSVGSHNQTSLERAPVTQSQYKIIIDLYLVHRPSLLYNRGAMMTSSFFHDELWD